MIVAGRGKCARCKADLVDAVLCPGCGDVFVDAVTDLLALLPELAVTVSKQDVVGQPVAHRLDPIEELLVEVRAAARLSDVRSLVANPMPVDLDAAALFTATRDFLVATVTRLSRRYEVPLGVPVSVVVAGPVCAGRCAHGSCRAVDRSRHVWCPDPDCSWCAATAESRRWGDRICGWLAGQVEAVRQDPAAVGLIRDLVRARARVEQAIDRRDPEVYVGPCDAADVEVSLDGDVVRLATEVVVDEVSGELVTVVARRICGEHMYARGGDAEVECPRCGHRYRVLERNEWLLEAVRDVWARPALIASALTSLQTPLTAGRLDQWISRDKRRHGRCPVGEPCGCILQVGIDSDEVNERGEPVGKPLYRIGDVLGRLEALRLVGSERVLEVASLR